MTLTGGVRALHAADKPLEAVLVLVCVDNSTCLQLYVTRGSPISCSLCVGTDIHTVRAYRRQNNNMFRNIQCAKSGFILYVCVGGGGGAGYGYPKPPPFNMHNTVWTETFAVLNFRVCKSLRIFAV